jgi:hypothetical protein
MLDDVYKDVMILSFGLAAWFVALGFLAGYTHSFRRKYRTMISRGSSLALAAMAFSEYRLHDRSMGNATTAFFLIGIVGQLAAYRRNKSTQRDSASRA